jgi:hypothetical protein
LRKISQDFFGKKFSAKFQIISFNSYDGWYPTKEPLTVDDVEQISAIWDFTSVWLKTNFPDKPLMCSETGAGEDEFNRHFPDKPLMCSETGAGEDEFNRHFPDKPLMCSETGAGEDENDISYSNKYY